MISTVQAVPLAASNCSYEHRITLNFIPSLALLPSSNALGDLFIDKAYTKKLYYLIHRAMYFKSCTNSNLVIKIDYLTIQIHALARQTDEVKAHIYCQLDLQNAPQLLNLETTDEEIVYEMQLIPENLLNLDQMFEEISVASALHPGIQDEDEGDIMGMGIDINH